jgi:hypothetical protein
MGFCLSAAYPCGAQLRVPCKTHMTTRAASLTARDQSDSVLRILNELDFATWEWMRRWLDTHAEPGVGFPPHDVQGLAEDVRSEMRQNPSSSRLIAIALTEMMRGASGGVSLGQGELAAAIYREWDLSPRPAISLLGDPRTSYRARRLAVLALEGHWGDTTFENAAVAALCILSAQVAGMSAMTDSTEIAALIDEDQSDFLGIVTAALVQLTDNPAFGTIVMPYEELPKGNPVTAYVKRAFCAVGSC